MNKADVLLWKTFSCSFPLLWKVVLLAFRKLSRETLQNIWEASATIRHLTDLTEKTTTMEEQRSGMHKHVLCECFLTMSECGCIRWRNLPQTCWEPEHTVSSRIFHSSLIRFEILKELTLDFSHTPSPKPNPPETCQQTWRHNDCDDRTSVHLFLSLGANQSKSVTFVIQ